MALSRQRRRSTTTQLRWFKLQSRIDAATADARRQLNAEIERLLAALDVNDVKATSDSLARVDTLRDELTQKLNSIRADMLALLQADAAMTAHKQRQAILIAAVLTALAAMLGIVFAILVSGGIARPVRRLLEGTRAVEAVISTQLCPSPRRTRSAI